ncbi:MAG: AtpZ/AtpI family protein [Candidatus Uhrbacteria bacterium]|nr:AtpZ/AtpI family protein [Candidatus Uhrbacteria bacterium]
MEEKPQKSQSDAYYYKLAFRMASDFGATLAIPALAAAYIGVKVDEKYGTEPFALAILLVMAFTFTAVFIVKKAVYYAKLYERGPK